MRLAAERGAACMAVTDHDRLSGLEEGRAAAEQTGAGFIPGIEISVQGNRELHILARKYLDLADEFGLLVTCGSDFHGEQAKPGFVLCGPSRDLSDEACELICERLKAAKTRREG